MRTLALASLPDDRRESVVRAIAAKGLDPAFADPADLKRYLCGPVFEMGRTCLTLWRDEVLLGTIAAVVREIPAKREAFLTFLHVFDEPPQAPLAQLLQAARAVLAACGADAGTAVRLGLAPAGDRLRRPLERLGWRAAFQVLDMARGAHGDLPEGPPLAFRAVGPETGAAFLSVHNAAFLHSPNGGQMHPEELDAIRSAVPAADLLQVAFCGAEPAAILELALRGDLGVIAALGVTPALQGRGYGKTALRQAIGTLADHGATRVRLSVVDANRPALALYRLGGFQVERVASTWYAAPQAAEAEGRRGP